MKDSTAPTIALKLFGAPCVFAHAAEVRLPSRKSLALLAYLAVEGRATRAKLAGVFWGDLDEASARRNLRRELARLRECGLAAALTVDDDSVGLAPDVGSDVAEFDRALGQRQWEAALAACGGPLLDGFVAAEAAAFDDWLAGQRERCAERFRKAAAEQAGLLEAAGDARAALEWHARLRASDPLQEAHYADGMRLHYLLGERAAALDLFERLRRTLRDELGLDPLPATAALAERIRVADQLPLAVPLTAGPTGELAAPLVGRAQELAALTAARVPVAVIVGEPGVGKTRLVQECAGTATVTVRVRCAEVARETALYPVAEALRALPAGRLAALDEPVRRELARLLPEIGSAGGGDAADSGPVARVRFFESLAAALLSLAGTGGFVWIDDAHWADASTLELLGLLARRAEAAGARVLVCARTQELRDRLPVRNALLALERAQLALRIELAPLTADDTLALVRALSGASEGSLFARRLQQATAGNPYFMLETIRFLFDSGELALDEHGRWATRYDAATADYCELPVPRSVADTVLERVERLGPAARRVLETAALTADGFTLDEVQPATALVDWEALEGLERAVQAQLLEREPVGFRFAHDLARGALATSLGPERRRLIHAKLATALESLKARPARIAAHHEGAGDRARALPLRLAAAREAERVFAHRETIEQYDHALADGPDDRQAFDIRTERFAALRSLSLIDEQLEELGRLQQLAARLADPALDFRIALQQCSTLINCGRTDEALAAAQRAIAIGAPSDQWRVQPLFYAGVASMFAGDDRQAEFYLLQAIEHAPRCKPDAMPTIASFLCHLAVNRADFDAAQRFFDLGAAHSDPAQSPLGRADVLNAGARLAEAIGRHATAFERLREAIALAAVANNVNLRLNYQFNLAHMLAGHGMLDEAKAVRAAMCALFTEAGDPKFRYMAAFTAARIATHEGDLGAAVRAYEESVALADEMGDATMRRGVRLDFARLFGELGQFERAEALAAAAEPLYRVRAGETVTGVEAVRAWAALARGNAAGAARRLQSALAGPHAADHDQEERNDLARCVRAAALLALGDAAAARASAAEVTYTPTLKAIAAAISCVAGGGDPAARALLAEPIAPLARLALLRALGDAGAAALAQSLALTLAAEPALQAGLLAGGGWPLHPPVPPAQPTGGAARARTRPR